MTVLFLSDSYTPYISGVVRSVAMTAATLRALGHRVVLAAPAYPGMRASGPDENGAYVLRMASIPAPGARGFRIPVARARGLLARLQALGPVDVVHAHSPFVAGRLALAVAREMGLPVVFTHHTLYHEYVHYARLPRRLAAAWVLRQVASFCRRVQHVVAPSTAVQELVRRTYGVGTPVSVVPTGIPVERFQGVSREAARSALGLPPQAPIVLYVGRLGREKNVGVLAEALGRTLHRVPVAHAVVVGGGPAEGELRRSPHLASAGQRLHLAGAVQPARVPLYYAAADLFLTASTTETQGLVAAEAMAAGLPVVAPAAAGLQEAVQHGVTGLLTSPEPGALTEQAVRLLTDPELRQRMAVAARARAAAYDVRETTRRLVEVYEATLAAARKMAGIGPGPDLPVA